MEQGIEIWEREARVRAWAADRIEEWATKGDFSPESVEALVEEVAPGYGLTHHGDDGTTSSVTARLRTAWKERK